MDSTTVREPAEERRRTRACGGSDASLRIVAFGCGLLTAAAFLLASVPVRAADSVAAAAARAAVAELEAAAHSDREAFRRSLEALAASAEQQSPPLKEKAAAARKLVPAETPDRITFFREPRGSLEGVPPNGSPAEVAWETQFRALRKAYAGRTWNRVGQAAKQNAAGVAETWLLETLHHDPDHAPAREILGRTPYRGEWIGAWEEKQVAAGKVRHAKFGWLRSSHVPEYDQGKRFWQGPGGAAKGEWISADEERRLRNMHGLPWETETEHYKVKSYVSLERAVELSNRLEELHEAWSHLFLTFWTDGANLPALYAKPRKSATKQLHKVVHFASKEQYVRELAKAAAGDISISTGIYFSEHETAYFFDGTEYDAITLLHEGTHQLFSETNPRVRAVGKRDGFWEKRRANFWVVEGIACYLESLRATGDQFQIGGFESDRFQAARLRALERKEYTPLSKLTQFGMLGLLRDPQIAAHYSQSLGQATFFMQGNGGRYREGFGDYLQSVYLGQDQPQSLAKDLDTPFGQLDSEYLKFLESTPARTP